MVKEHIAVVFDFADEVEFLLVYGGEKLSGRGIPCIGEDHGEGDLVSAGAVDEFEGEVDFGFEVWVMLCEGKLGGWFIEPEVDRESFLGGGEGGVNDDVADRFPFEDAAILQLSAFGLFGIDFGSGGIVDNKGAVRCRRAGAHTLEELQPCRVQFVAVPLRVGEEILDGFVVGVSF